MSHHRKNIPKRRARGKWMRKGYGNQTREGAQHEYKKLARGVRKRAALVEASP